MRHPEGKQMTALEHEITTTQIVLFQRTGKLLEIADEVKRDREKLMRLLKDRQTTEPQEQQRDEVTR
jgi:hypothetical protein